MSDAVHDDHPKDLIVVPIDEALRLAQPWPWDEPSALEGISDEEWNAFVQALAER